MIKLYFYEIGDRLTASGHEPAEDTPAVVLMSSEELSHGAEVKGLDRVIRHTPSARDARVCKAEVRSDCLTGTLVIPQAWKDGGKLACGYLITAKRVILVDDTGALASHIKHISKEKYWMGSGVGRFLCFPAAFTACRLVWNEFHRHAGAYMEIRLPCDSCGEYLDSACEHTYLQKEKVLVTALFIYCFLKRIDILICGD